MSRTWKVSRLFIATMAIIGVVCIGMGLSLTLAPVAEAQAGLATGTIQDPGRSDGATDREFAHQRPQFPGPRSARTRRANPRRRQLRSHEKGLLFDLLWWTLRPHGAYRGRWPGYQRRDCWYDYAEHSDQLHQRISSEPIEPRPGDRANLFRHGQHRHTIRRQ